MASISNNGEGPSTLPEPSDKSILSDNLSNVAHRRIFIGPMPEKVIAHTEAAQGKRTKLTVESVFSLSLDKDNAHHPDKREEVSRVLKDNAFKFFLHKGGKAEDWGTEQEEGTVEELLNRWKESDWGKLWTHRHHHKKKKEHQGDDNWFGTSFEVGALLGVNVMQGNEHLKTKAVPSKPLKPTPTDIVSESVAPTGMETFVTAPSSIPPAIPQINAPVQQNNLQLRYSPENEGDLTPASSSTGLLARQANSEGHLRVDLKGKAKMVQYEDSSTNPSGTPPRPAPPEDVLSRTKTTVEPNTSLAATIANESRASSPSELQWGDVVLKDRMLVRVSYTKLENIAQFDDAINRTTRNLRYEDWGEFLVAWRKDRIEVYKDHTTPGKDWMTGHKHLAYIIPLRSSRTRLSLYSFIDLTFSISCAPTPTRLNSSKTRWIFNGDKDGTNIFIFKLKSRTRAYDWTWQLWRFMGGQIPTSIDIYNPRMSTKVTIDIPDAEGSNTASLYSTFTRENIIKLCTECLRNVPDWQYLMERQLQAGKSVQLAWRVGAHLDWIWLEEDVCGIYRNWSVLCGLAFKQSTRPPVLEARLAEHFPTHIHTKAGKHIDEPPSIEGYLHRIRPNSQSRQSIYLSTHNGNLFTLNIFQAFPPMPPGLAPAWSLYVDPETRRHAEVRRGTNQIMMATGVCDLRNIIAVRRASHPVPTHMHDQKEQAHDDDTWFGVWENSSEDRHEHDEHDEGGEAGLDKFGDRTRMRIRRSFELLLRTGNVVRFEAHSCQAALEWIQRLRDLIFYWKSRHRIDAKEEIELAQAHRPRLTPLTRVLQDDEREPPEPPADPSAPYASMSSMYNWCILEGCMPICKGGRLYVKKGLHGQYKHIQLFLVAGHLVRFHIGPQSSLYPAVRKKINLLDAYVCSGYFAAMTLPKGQYSPNAAPAPRRYQDGLETEDREEDMIFMLWYRPQPQMLNADQDPTAIAVDTKFIPQLSSKNKVLVFKTRSLLERDSWCWAINSEIEKIVRAQRKREEILRETGNLLKLE